jgi:hypothetical protein
MSIMVGFPWLRASAIKWRKPVATPLNHRPRTVIGDNASDQFKYQSSTTMHVFGKPGQFAWNT